MPPPPEKMGSVQHQWKLRWGFNNGGGPLNRLLSIGLITGSCIELGESVAPGAHHRGLGVLGVSLVLLAVELEDEDSRCI